MKQLEKNIINAHGNNGKQWLHSLPKIIEILSSQWQLTNVTSVKNMNWNFVAFAKQKNEIPVVLKISFDKKLIEDEYQALKYFAGKGAIKVINFDSQYNAILLERATPGCLLKEHHPISIQETINIYAKVIKKIFISKIPSEKFTHVSKWCKVIDEINDEKIPKDFVTKAKSLKNELLSTMHNEYLCHGDLHLENIIQRGSDWVVIDPKGMIGEMAFEAAAFDLISSEEMDDIKNISHKMQDRIKMLSQALEISFERLLSWIFLRMILSVQWFIEDNGDPSQMLMLAKHLYPLFDDYKFASNSSKKLQ